MGSINGNGSNNTAQGEINRIIADEISDTMVKINMIEERLSAVNNLAEELQNQFIEGKREQEKVMGTKEIMKKMKENEFICNRLYNLKTQIEAQLYLNLR